MQHAQVLVFRRVVASGYQDDESHTVNVTGRVASVIFQFPPGPQFLVDARVLLVKSGSSGTISLVPSDPDTYVTLDGASPEFRDLDIEVEAGDAIMVEWVNRDAANDHQVPVLVTVLPDKRGE